MKALVADDDPVCLQLLQSYLTQWGHEPVLCADGLDALRVLEGEDAPRLVILDWTMPGMEGTEVCRRLRQMESGRYTQVLLVTSHTQTGDMVGGMDSGADDYITKPFDARELKARLDAAIRKLLVNEQLLSAQESLRRQATTDPLTGTRNRSEILAVVGRELARAGRERNFLGVAILDLDYFKKINDTLGHLAGDQVLRAVTERIMNQVRPYDMLGRYGGDEFLLVIPGTSEDSVLSVAERIRAAVSECPFDIGGRGIPLTVTIGATVIDGTFPLSVEEAIELADQALLTAKRMGRNRVEFSSAGGSASASQSGPSGAGGEAPIAL